MAKRTPRYALGMTQIKLPTKHEKPAFLPHTSHTKTPKPKLNSSWFDTILMVEVKGAKLTLSALTDSLVFKKTNVFKGNKNATQPPTKRRLVAFVKPLTPRAELTPQYYSVGVKAVQQGKPGNFFT